MASYSAFSFFFLLPSEPSCLCGEDAVGNDTNGGFTSSQSASMVKTGSPD